MMVVRMRRGWRLRLTDNEFELLREAVTRGLGALDEAAILALPYKVRKVFESKRWADRDPLTADGDRRSP